MKSTMISFIQKSPKTATLLIILGPVFLLIILLKMSNNSVVGNTANAPKASEVSVIAAKQSDSFTRPISVFGKVESLNEAVVSFENNGLLLSVLVNEGDYVSAGQTLAQLDTDRLQAQLGALNASLARAEADERLAILLEKRIESLISQKLESPQRLDQARESTKASTAVVNEIKARITQGNIDIDNATLKAPFSGWIMSRLVDVGTTINYAQPIFRIQQADLYEIRFGLANQDVTSLTVGQTYSLQHGDATHNAKLRAVGSTRNNMTRTVDVLFRLKNTNGHLVRPGDLMSLSLEQQVTEAGYWVPITALSASVRGMWSLLTVQNVGDNQILTPKIVEVLFSEGKGAYVRGALTLSDYIVIEGAHRFVPRQIVTAKEQLPDVVVSQ